MRSYRQKNFTKIYCALLVLNLAAAPYIFAQSTGNHAGNGPAKQTENPSRPTPANGKAKVVSKESLQRDFDEALAVIQTHHIDGTTLNHNNLFKSSIIGALRSLDPHSNFFDAKEWEEQQNEWRSEYFGIGATIGDRRVNGRVNTYVLATFPDAPALKAGLRFGDKIVEVDGKTMDGKTSAEVRDVLRGRRGTPVRITIERARDGQRQTVEVIRNAVPLPSIPDAYVIRPSVGYMAMTQGFNRTTADEFKRALKELQALGITSLVIDLRNNGGGMLDTAIRVAEQFLQSGDLVMTQSGRRVKREYKSQNLNPDKMPLVVLVNRGTASAAEVAAGAWQDHDRALIVGEMTFGKGLVQSVMPLDSGTALTLTTSKYQTPSGRIIQRDYSKGLYDYIFDGGVGSGRAVTKPSGPEFRTDMGRPIYSGNGITPDEVVKARTLSPRQQGLFHPVFAFVRELVNGRVTGFEKYKTQSEIDFTHNIAATDFPVTDDLFEAFKKFATSDPAQKLTHKQLDAEREFIARQLRYDIATAFYGTTKALRVLIADDPQMLHAIQALPRAANLARVRNN